MHSTFVDIGSLSDQGHIQPQGTSHTVTLGGKITRIPYLLCLYRMIAQSLKEPMASNHRRPMLAGLHLVFSVCTYAVHVYVVIDKPRAQGILQTNLSFMGSTLLFNTFVVVLRAQACALTV